MSNTDKELSELRPHHVQKELCTTRLPYRQGRKLTAVKVYTINNESKHLLIFGVPSLNLRQETKALFMKFGKLLLFNITNYPSEQFTETYHALYESLQAARIAKKMLDTKNYYGGHLHICYAPEFETIEEVQEKLLLRKTQVIGRLKNLKREAELSKQILDSKLEDRLNIGTGKNEDKESGNIDKMNMGAENTIVFGKRKFDRMKKEIVKKQKMTHHIDSKNVISNVEIRYDRSDSPVSSNIESNITDVGEPSQIDVVDCTSTETDIISNINEALNYNNFGNEIIRTVPLKPVNKIKFNISKKS